MTGSQEGIYELKTEQEGLEFIPTKHSANMDCYGFKIQLNDKNIVYTGDTCELTPFLPYLKEANEFYVDTSIGGAVHLKIDEVLAELLQIQNNGTTVFLMHLDNENAIRKITENQLSFVKEII